MNPTGLEAKNSLSVNYSFSHNVVSLMFAPSQHTPLYVACEKGEVACVKVLLSFGASLKYTLHGDKFSCLNAAIDANKR